jgi:uncharacterized repeat protein (TIGR01451 family)/LPXTG-motif cell wall-anchored protein
VLWNNTTVGINVTNEQPTGGGNDGAFDNVILTDVTPQLDKKFSPAKIAVGGTSTLTFTITNTKELAAKPGWNFVDTLPTGLPVSSKGAAATTCPSGAVTAASGDTKITVTGDLSKGMVSCTVTVPVLGATAGSYVNGPGNVTGTGINPPANTPLVVGTPPVVGAPSFTVTKTAAKASLVAGATQSYTVVVKNTGPVAYTAGTPATFTDDLTGVLDDAVYNKDAKATSGTTSYTSPNLVWSGALPIGGTVTVTYTATVNTPDSGNATLTNTITTPAGLGGNCGTGSTDSGCATSTPVTAALAETGTDSQSELEIALGLLVAGGALAVVGRRRYLARHSAS